MSAHLPSTQGDSKRRVIFGLCKVAKSASAKSTGRSPDITVSLVMLIISPRVWRDYHTFRVCMRANQRRRLLQTAMEDDLLTNFVAAAPAPLSRSAERTKLKRLQRHKGLVSLLT